MLHYSNASSIEKNMRYLVIKEGGLPGCSDKREVVNSVVELGVADSLKVYRKEVTDGEHNK